MRHRTPLHAYRLVLPDGDQGREFLWEWEQPYIDRLLWNAKTFGRRVAQRYFADWDALAQENQRIWEASYRWPAYESWEGWQRWLSEHRTLVAVAQEVYEAQYGAHATTPTWSHKPLRQQHVMNPLKRLWHWWRDRRVERQALKGHDGGEPHRPKGTTPIVGIAEDARIRWLMKSGRR